MFSPLKLKGKNRSEIPLSVLEVGFFEKGKWILILESQGMQETHQNLVGLGSFGRAVLKAPVPQDHMRADHPLSQVVVERNSGNLKKG